MKRRRHRSSSSSSSSRSSSDSRKRNKNPRGQNTGKEEGIQRHLLLLPHNLQSKIMEDIKEQGYLHSLQKFSVLRNLLGLWIRHRLYIRIMWCNNKRTQVPNQTRKPGPLTGLLMSGFRLLPQELCPRPTEKNTPTKPLSGIDYLMENRASPLVTLPQSKLVEGTTKFIQSKIDSETLTKIGYALSIWFCL